MSVFSALAPIVDDAREADYSPVEFSAGSLRCKRLEHTTLLTIAEAVLRIILGIRFLSSGISNVLRWPNPVQTASLVFLPGAVFFGFLATVLMVVGGIGVAIGFQTPVSSLMLVIFLIPTFNVHQYWLKTLPTMVDTVKNSLDDEQARNYFRIFDRQAYHAHEVGIRDNLVLLAAAVYFAVRGSVAYGVDNLIDSWVVRPF